MNLIALLITFKVHNNATDGLNPIQYGLFLKHYSMGGGGIMAPLVTLLFLKIEGQNLVGSGILTCFLQKWH